MPLVSIIIPTYNSSRTIENCMQSCIKYAFDCEIIIQDGNSSDNTVSIAKQFNHPNIKFNIQSDFGVYDAMNKALEFATGKYVYFLGSDDEITFGFREVLKFTEKLEYSIVYAKVRLKYRDVLINEKRNFYDLLFEGNISPQGILYGRHLFEIYTYNLNFPIYSDYHLNLKLWHNKSIKKKYLNVEICTFNDKDGLTGKNTPDVNFHEYRERLRAKKKHGLIFNVIRKCRKIVFKQ